MRTEKADLLFLPYTAETNIKTLAEYWSMAESQDVIQSNFSQKRIIFSHNNLKNVQYGYYTSKEGLDLADIENNSDLFINGHIHNGMFLNDKETILNLGILSGQNFNEDAFKYSHLACIIDTDTLELTFFENPFAFNFYKLEIAKEADFAVFKTLKANSVATIRVVETLVSRVREIAKTVNNLVEHRIISYRDSSTHSNTDNHVELAVSDHLKQFYDFVVEKVEDSVVSHEILKEELSKVLL